MKRLVLALVLVSCGGGATPAPTPNTPSACTGDPQECYAAAKRLFDAGGDAKHAASLMEGACRAGAGAACRDLGLRIEHGRGLFEDPKKAYELFLLGDKAGDPTSSASAGVLIVTGKVDRPHDPEEAGRLLGKGCDAKLAWACFRLGTAWAGGSLGHPDPAAALTAFTEACDLKDGIACLVASQMTAAGKGTAADPERAAALAKHACDLGVARACPKPPAK